MASDHDLRRAIEQIKLRAPIEDLVRERVPTLKKSGSRWVACCPFHEERTPSFSVNAREGFWYCFGACGTGGDQIKFLQMIDHLSFMDALEILAARTGVELPRRSRRDPADDSGLEALARADELYQRQLGSREGRATRDYLTARGLEPNTVEAFGVGYAPASGQALVTFVRSEGLDIGAFERAGLVRTRDDGRPYDFFRGRLMIPIRDLRGRTVGFGARRLDDEAGGPKYINTPETPYFHKGRLVYALDRAVDAARRDGHLVLVEGYTDVMAAHQVGLANVAAVLGTSTTEDHAALVRRTGARRISLVFDGDDAGRAAAHKALHGLLPLDADLFVAGLPGGADPCDVLIQEGAQGFVAALELAAPWLDFVVDGITGLAGRERAAAVDGALELCGRVRKPVHRDFLLGELAERLGIPLDTLREEWRTLGHRGADGNGPGPPRRAPGPDRADPGPAKETAAKPLDPRVILAYKGAVGAALVDTSLVPRLRDLRERCPHRGLSAILETVLGLWDENGEIDAANVMTALGADKVRDRVPGLVEWARSADDPTKLLEESIRSLNEYEHESEKRSLRERVRELERAELDGDARASEELPGVLARLNELQRATPQPS